MKFSKLISSYLKTYLELHPSMTRRYIEANSIIIYYQ